LPATRLPLESRFAWTVVGLLSLGSVVNYMDRAVLGVVMPEVRHALALSNTGYGISVNAFLMTYMVSYVLGGRLADRFGSRRVFSASLLVWSAASIAHSLVHGLPGLCLCRAALGVGEGAFYPAAIRGAGEWFSVQNRAKAIGLFLAGISVGALITPPAAAWIAVHYGWRAVFLLTGTSGLLLLPAWQLLHRSVRRAYCVPDPAPAYLPDEECSDREAEVSLVEAFTARKYWLLLLSRAVSDACWYFYLFWIPAWFQEVRGFTPAMVGRFLWIPFFAAGIGSLTGAWASSALIERGMVPNRARKTVLLLSAVACVAGVSAFLARPFPALALVTVALFGYQSWSANLHTAITEVSPRRYASILYGITGASGALAGAISQPLIGRIVDLRGYNAVFAMVGSLHLLAAVLLVSAGKIERIQPLPARRFAVPGR